jgi:hypothetical protein
MGLLSSMNQGMLMEIAVAGESFSTYRANMWIDMNACHHVPVQAITVWEFSSTLPTVMI